MSDREGFCILPFTTVYAENNRVRLCCESTERVEKYITTDNTIADIWNSDFYKQTRAEMLDGKLPDYCRICQLNEQVGEESKRQWENSQFTKLIEDIDNFQTVDSPLPINFDIRPSNKCNLECVMCNGIVSTAIDKRVREYTQDSDFVIRTGQQWTEQYYYIDYIKENSSDIRQMKFAGGEPFLMPEVIDIIDYLVDSGDAPNIRISFITNGTVVRQNWLDKLRQFKDVKLNVSVDGVGEIGEYVRYPTKWSTVDANLQKLAQLSQDNKNVRLSLSPVMHLLNAMHMDSVLEYAAVNNINIALGMVWQASNEEYLSVKLLSNELRQQAHDKMQVVLEKYPDISFNMGSGFIRNLIQTEYQPDQRATDKLKQAVKYWDSHREVKFTDLYPYLNYLI